MTQHVQHFLKAGPDLNDEGIDSVASYLKTGPTAAWTQRPCWPGPPGHSAMKPRLRDMEIWRKEPLPTLMWTCRMCEAEFPNRETLIEHINLLHGQYRFYSTWLGGVYSQAPYIVSPTEKRAVIEHFAKRATTRHLESCTRRCSTTR